MDVLLSKGQISGIRNTKFWDDSLLQHRVGNGIGSMCAAANELQPFKFHEYERIHNDHYFYKNYKNPSRKLGDAGQILRANDLYREAHFKDGGYFKNPYKIQFWSYEKKSPDLKRSR